MSGTMYPPAETVKKELPAAAELVHTRPLDLSSMGKMALTSYAKGYLFPLMYQLGEAVRQKGKLIHAVPRDETSPATHLGHTLIEDNRAENQGWYHISLLTPIEGEQLTERSGTLGAVSWTLDLFDHTPGITLHGLRHREVAATNHYPKTVPQIIDSTEALFGGLPRNIYSPSNPALWIARLVQNDTLETMQASLANMPILRD